MTLHAITTPPRLLLQALLLMLTAVTATAQIQNPAGPVYAEPGLEGWSDVLTGDGEEIGVPRGQHWEADVLITDNGDGTLRGDVFVDFCDGWGPTWIPGELLTIHPLGRGRYVWESAQGGTGIIVWNPYLGHYDNLVTGGNSAGTERIILPHPAP